ncbi:hypothetical protein H5T52_06620 [Candidatus Bipolaricaulota bacterium]|nr:hypothetical protein [Candidatus Bipolaricaulota bacterium]
MKSLVLFAALGLILAAGNKPPLRPLSFDSAARAVGEVARALGGPGRGLLDPYPPAARPVLFALRYAPKALKRAVLDFGMARSLGVPLSALARFDLEAFFRAYTSRYPAGIYPTIVLGAPGGGVAHLAALLGAPLLPACGLLGARHRIEPDDLSGYLKTGMEAAKLLSPDGRFEVIVHYDPIHDRDLVRHAALLRVRLLSLPEAYLGFIRKHLAPGGVLILAEGTYTWPQVELSPGVWLQLGGLGGISPQEYLQAYPPPGEAEPRRESEWGCPEAFAEAVRELAAEGGYRLIELPAAHPTEYSRLALRAYLAAGAREDVVLVDCFTTMDARLCLASGIPPLHLPFHTRDALAFAEEMLEEHPVKRGWLALHPSYNPPPDMVPLSEWKSALDGVLELLVDERFWPEDPYAPFAVAERFSEIAREYALPEPLSLPVERLEELLP